MHTLTIKHPTHTKGGKVAQSAKYTVTTSAGGEVTQTSLPKFCEQQDVSFQGLLRLVRPWDSGDHTDNFKTLLDKMKRRQRGAYAHHGRSLVCPHCNKSYKRMEGVFAKRRLLRDASAPNHILRAMPPEYFGEAPSSLEPDATQQAMGTN